jgi:hypothetical protein
MASNSCIKILNCTGFWKLHKNLLQIDSYQFQKSSHYFWN